MSTEANNHRPIALRVDHMTRPIAIATQRPRFSWRIESDATSVLQQSYEIEVTAGDSLVWASGIVIGRDTTGIVYDGAALVSRTSYRWRVRSWMLGDALPTGWVEGSFATSLLHVEDWTAEWVIPAQAVTVKETYSLAGALSGTEAPSDEPDQRLLPPRHIRQGFTAARRVSSARLYASAKGIYEVEINGAVVGDEVLAPGFDSYPHRISFQAYDVSELVSDGANVLGVTVADGWWAGRIGLTGSSANYGDTLTAIWQLELTYDDGSTETIVSGSGACSSTGARLYADLFVGESVDARLEPTGWSSVGFDDSEWEAVTTTMLDRELLVPFAGEPVRRIMEFAPEAIITTPKGDTVIDLGQVIAGRLRIALDVPRGTRITLEHAEVLDAEGEYFPNIMGPNKDQTDVYTAAGGRESFEPTFTFHGFRYVRVTGLDEACTLAVDDVTAVVLGSDLRQTSSFETSDPRIDRLHQNVVWSQRANFLSIPTDCPQRERAGWTGDLQVFMPTASTNMDVLPFVERWLANLRADQLDDGRVPIIVPVIPSVSASDDDGDLARGDTSMVWSDTSAAWSDAVVMVPWVLYERFGDTEPLRQNYDAMTMWVEFQMRQAETELPSRFDDVALDDEKEQHQRLLWNTGFHFGDWLAPSTLLEAPMPDSAMIAPRRTGEIVAAMFHANSLSLLARTARVLGNDADAERYSQRFEDVQMAFVAEYVDGEGRLPVQMQGPYVLALAFGLLDGDQRTQAISHLVTLIHEADDHLDAGFVSVPYLLDVLWDAGEQELARTVLGQDTIPSWLYEVDQGATTIWEAWGAVLPDGTVSPMSMNHYAFGCVDDWVFRRIAGLQPIEPGYRHTRIEPDFASHFTKVSASHDTPSGRLSVNWTRDGDIVSIDTEVPPNTTAELVMGSKTITLGSGHHHHKFATNSL